MELIYTPLIVLLFFYLVIFMRLVDMGMIKKKALIRTLIFPFIIMKIHIQAFLKAEDRSFFFKMRVLFYPITNLPNAIIAYGEMYIQGDVFLKAIHELEKELSKEEFLKLLLTLEKEGVIRNVRVQQSFTSYDPQAPNLNDFNWGNGNALV